MVISVELANVCLHACLGAKVSGEELWHLISHMNNHFMGKKKPSRTSETAKKKKKSSLWSTAKPSKPANDSEIVCSHTYRVTSTFNKRHQQMFLCVSNTALVQSPLPEAKSSIQPNTSSILCLPVTPADQHFLWEDKMFLAICFTISMPKQTVQIAKQPKRQVMKSEDE